jgi:chromosome segregation ATPase
MNIAVDDWEGILSLFLQFLWMYTDLAVKLEVANKAVAGERSSRQVADQAILAAQESNTALSRDLQVVRASTGALTEELEATRTSTAAANQQLSSKLAALDEITIRERIVQDKLQALGEENNTHEHLLESTRKMLSEHDYSSSTVISSVVAHAVALLKSYVPDLDTKLLCRDYPFDDDDE